MIFSSTLFLFLFLPVILFLYYVIPARFLNLRNAALLLASLLFYAWGESRVVLVMLVSIAGNYALGLAMGRKKTRWLLAATVAFNLAMLGYFKYANFFAENMNALFNLGLVSNVALPIGISFFTFQIMSYSIDVYRGHVAPQRSVFKLALYISFFPQLIAGPIVRYVDIERQLQFREHSWSEAAGGFLRFILGLAKKVLIANQAAVFADHAFNGAPPAAVAWLGAVCYALQIYFDFSGYSDMAIGLGRMFGFNFNENFNYPYAAVSVQDFWRRWHISLSTWFRDYLYIPLGGNRRGAARTYANLLIVFLVTGFWHGASWSFVVWGVYHGLFLMLERGAWGRLLCRLPKAVAWGYTALVVLVGWVIFRAENLAAATEYLSRMFNFTSDAGWANALANLNPFILTALTAGLVAAAPVLPYVKGKLLGGAGFFTPTGQAAGQTEKRSAALARTAALAAAFALLLLSVLFLTGSDFNPFLYWRF